MDRILTALAGPIMNMVLGVCLALVIWKVGIIGSPPSDSFVLADVPATYKDAEKIDRKNPEYEAGLRAGDRVVPNADGDTAAGGNTAAGRAGRPAGVRHDRPRDRVAAPVHRHDRGGGCVQPLRLLRADVLDAWAQLDLVLLLQV